MNSIKKLIRKTLFEQFEGQLLPEEILDEERIANDDARELAKQRINFLGSHVFGEKLVADGEDLDGMDEDGDGKNDTPYVICSYTEEMPIYIYVPSKKDSSTGTWFENRDEYNYNGEEIENTEEHKKQVRPTMETVKKTRVEMRNMLSDLMKEAGISELSHKSVPPGEK